MEPRSGLLLRKDMDDVNLSKFMAGMVFYGVPTISVDFDELPKRHFEITRTWLAFYNRHLQRFMTGQIDHLSDDFHYSTARVSSDGFTYIPCFLREWPSVLAVLPDHAREIYLANMTSQPRILTRIEGMSGTYSIATTDLMLTERPGVQHLTSKNGALDIEIEVPVGGMLVLRKK